MPKLNDTQAVLLATAAQRDDRHLLPFAAALGTPNDRVRKAIAALIKHGLIKEQVTTTAEQVWRNEDDQRLGLVISSAGLQAIGVEHAGLEASCEQPVVQQSDVAPNPPAERQTKSKLVLSMLSRNEGATLAEMVEATGWLPHTTRAALTGLRRKGHSVAKGKRGDMTCYSIASA